MISSPCIYIFWTYFCLPSWIRSWVDRRIIKFPYCRDRTELSYQFSGTYKSNGRIFVIFSMNGNSSYWNVSICKDNTFCKIKNYLTLKWNDGKVCQFSAVFINIVKPANTVTSIKQSPVLKGHYFIVLSYEISYDLNPM